QLQPVLVQLARVLSLPRASDTTWVAHASADGKPVMRVKSSGGLASRHSLQVRNGRPRLGARPGASSARRSQVVFAANRRQRKVWAPDMSISWPGQRVH